MPNTIVSKASASWQGDLISGSGTTTLETSGLGTFPANWKARAEESAAGTTSPPEELIGGAAHATCFAMAFSNGLAKNGTPPTQLDTSAAVSFVAGKGITGIALTVRGQVPGLSAEEFGKLAEEAKAGCPVSQALAGVPITLTASLA